MELVVVGLSWKTAPVALREKLAVPADELAARLREVLAAAELREVALISTCNRVEIYAATSDDTGAAAETLARHLAARAEGDLDVDGALYRRMGGDALLHLFRVAASLDSQVVGEPQILGQLKDAWDAATRAGTTGTFLGACFPRAFRVARRVRRETEIARHVVSVSSVAVEQARRVFEGFAGRLVLLVGAGKMADLAARALRAQGAQVLVTNRTRARADELAARLGCEVEDFAALERALARADIVITSTGARQPILTRALLERVQRSRHGRPLVVVDIAVPRDVEPGAGDVDGVFLWDMDALEREAAKHREGRQKEADRAEILIASEVKAFRESQRGRGVGPTITALRSRFLSVAGAETDRVLGALPDLDERTRREIARLGESIAAKLLHAPQVALKRAAAGQGDGDDLVRAAERLFELPAVEPVADGDDSDDDEKADPAGRKAAKT